MLPDAVRYASKLALCGLIHFVSTLVLGGLLSAVGIAAPAMPWSMNPADTMMYSLMASAVLALGVAPIASGIAGSFRRRAGALAMFVFIALGVNTLLELSIFSTMLVKGGSVFMLIMNLGGAVALAFATARLFAGAADRVVALYPRRSALDWTWRVGVAVLAFPVIYLVFGGMVTPFVIPQYQQGAVGLVLPPMATIVAMQIPRSVLFLLASAPLVFSWTGSGSRLILALGWAHAVAVGLFGMVSGYFLPTVLRIAHGIEITADSFVYALVIVVLLRPRSRAEGSSRVARAA